MERCSNKASEPDLRILLVYESLDIPDEIEKTLLNSNFENFHFECLSVPLNSGGTPGKHDICLLESTGDSAIQHLLRLKALLNCPILVLTRDSGTEVLNALRYGAADCLIRGRLNPAELEESICVAVENARVLQSLDQYERWYLSLIEHSNDLIFTQDLEGNISSISQVVQKLTGFTPDEMVGMNFRQFIAPEYSDLLWKNMIRMLEDRQPSTIELAIVSKNRNRIRVRMTAHLVYRHGAPTGIQGVMRVLTGHQPWASSSMPSNKRSISSSVV